MDKPFTIRHTLYDVTPQQAYDAWMSQEAHSAFTQSECRITTGEGEAFMTYDDYITGTNVELIPGKKIVQRWRTVEFPEDAPDSLLEVSLKAEGNDCVLTLRHSEIPTGQAASYEQGWKDHYFEPMASYFSG